MGNLKNLEELVLANNKIGGEIPEELDQLASLKVLQIQNNRIRSFRGIEKMKSRALLVFDTDERKYDKRFDENAIKNSRMADTKFEDEDDDNDN